MSRGLCWSAALVLLALGCSEQGKGGDAGLDLLLVDGTSTDAAAEGGPGDAATDAAVDAGTDLAQPDLGLPADAAPPSDAVPGPASVVYTVAQDTNSFGLRVAHSSGSPAPLPLTGWSGFVDFEPLQLTGHNESPAVNAHLPRVSPAGHPDLRGIVLPAGLGALYYFHRKLAGSSGLLRISADGTLQVVLERPGLYSDTLAQYVALSPDGTRGAVVAKGDAVWLFRTDGQPMASGGAASAVALPAGAVQGSPVPRSLTVAGSWLFGVSQGSDGDILWRAPLDGSAPATPVKLPASPAVIATPLLVTQDQQHLLLVAGASAAARDLYLVQTAAGTATRLTSAPSQVVTSGSGLGQPPGTTLAVSPSATQVAFVRWVQGGPELYLVAGDGSGKEVHLTDATHFDSKVQAVLNLHFADDQHLLFMAGVTVQQLDLYAWDLPSAAAQNLTGHGNTSVPFEGYGGFYPAACWLSPNAELLYWIARDTMTQQADLRGIRLSSLTLVEVTQGAEVLAGAQTMAACPTSGALTFVAEPVPTQNNREIWTFDQNAGTKATRITSMGFSPTATWYVFDLALSADCQWVSWSAGGGYSLRQVYAAPAAGPQWFPVTLVPRYVGPSLGLFPAAGGAVFFGSGGGDTSATLKVSALAASAPVHSLDPQAGVVQIFAVY